MKKLHKKFKETIMKNRAAVLKKLLRKVLLPNAPDERMFLGQHLSAFAKNKSNKLILDVGAGECQYAYLFTEKNKYESCDLENGFHQGIKHDIISTCYNIGPFLNCQHQNR